VLASNKYNHHLPGDLIILNTLVPEVESPQLGVILRLSKHSELANIGEHVVITCNDMKIVSKWKKLIYSTR